MLGQIESAAHRTRGGLPIEDNNQAAHVITLDRMPITIPLNRKKDVINIVPAMLLKTPAMGIKAEIIMVILPILVGILITLLQTVLKINP